MYKGVKVDETMKDEGVGQINMYDTFLGLVPKESGIEFHILNTWQTRKAFSQLNGALTKINTQKNHMYLCV